MFSNNTRVTCALISKLSLALLAGAALALTSKSLAAPGDLYVTDLATGSVIVYAPDGTPTTFDTGLTSPQGIAFDQDKNLYVVDAGDGTDGAGTIFKYDLAVGGGSKTPFFTGLNNPQGLALDGSVLLVSEKGGNRIRRLPLDGGATSVFKLFDTPMGLDSRGINDGAGAYRWVANGPSVFKVFPDPTIVTEFPFTADGSRSVALDLTGNAFVSTDTGLITEIFVADDTMATFASSFTQPTGMDFRPAKFSGDMDRVGFLYVADTATGEIFQISSTGTVTPFVTGAGMPNYMVFETNGPPVVVTGIASNITSTTATLNGTVNPNGNPTTYHFQYGLTTAYGSNTTTTNAGSGRITLPVSAGITGLTPGAVYHFRITATNGGGTVVGADSTFTASAGQPTPAPIVVTGIATLITDTTATLNGTVNPTGSATTYQFQYGLTTAYGSTTTATSAGSGFTAVPVSAPLTGLTLGTLYHFRVTATNVGGTANGADATFTTTAPAPADTALNLSTRVDVETVDNVGIGGFIIKGTDPKVVAIRGIGPSLATGNPPIAGALSDPFLELHDSTGAIIATNDNWMDNSATDQATLVAQGLDPKNALESALVATLPASPTGIGYTAVMRGVNNATGIGLVEVYDLDDPSVVSELANLSTRGLVGTDDNVLIGGVILGPVGGMDATVVIRAIGPSLANANPPVANALIDPVLELHNGNGDLIAMNDNWQTDLPPDNYSAQVTASGLAPAADAESAIYADLFAGNYTAVVSGKDGTTGVGLVEIYHVPAVSVKSADK